MSIKETDAFIYFESAVKELCDKNIDKPEMFPSFNSIKNRECYLDDLVDVANLAEDVLKKVRKRIEQVNIQQKEEIDKFDEQIKKLKQHNLEIAGKLTDITDSLEKANSAKELSYDRKELNVKNPPIAAAGEIPVPPKLKPAPKTQSNFEKPHEFGDIMHLLDDSFSRELLPTDLDEVGAMDPLPTVNAKSNKLAKHGAYSPVNPIPTKSEFTLSKGGSFSAEIDSDWSIVTPRKHKKRASGPYAQIYDTDAMNLSVYKPVVVAGEYAIKAVICNDWPEITEMLEGCMYYVTSADHFAIKLCGVMLHGNIGEIYTNERNPVKIKECKFGADCNKDNCEYYHDPLFSEGKKDIRNYIAGSFLYSPLTGLKPKSIGSRKIGSRSTIESDINRLDEYDIKLHRDQVMHDLLCCLLVPL